MDSLNGYPLADRALAKRLERTEASGNARFVEARAAVAPEVGACWIEVAGAYALFDGIDSPLTQTFGLALFEPVGDEQLDAIERFYRQRQAPVFHEVSPMADASIVGLLNSRGYEPFELTSVMYRPIERLDAPDVRPSSVGVRVAKPGEHDRWASIAAEGWRDTPEIVPFVRELGKVTTARRDILLFLAELEGEPVAAAALSIHEGVALLAGASTVPSARGRGAQLALLNARLRAAQRRGCTLAMMGAQPGSGSQRNAERNGFRIAYTRIKWRLCSDDVQHKAHRAHEVS